MALTLTREEELAADLRDTRKTLEATEKALDDQLLRLHRMAKRDRHWSQGFMWGMLIGSFIGVAFMAYFGWLNLCTEVARP